MRENNIAGSRDGQVYNHRQIAGARNGTEGRRSGAFDSPRLIRARNGRARGVGRGSLAEFDGGREYSLLDRVRLENRLADLLGVKVDLSPARMLKEGVRERAAREAVLAF